jgi:hypothetical protein
MAKTVRFGDLVRESGRPEVVTLWVDPKKDPSFSKAIKENRVLTVLTDPGSHRKEYGRIGFHQHDGAIYLMFPRPLPKQVDSRVVGINYQLTEDRPPKDPVTSEFLEKLTTEAKIENARARKEVQKEKPESVAAPPKPKPKTFELTVRRVATLDVKQRVKAHTEEAAKEAALEAVKKKRFEIGRANVRNEILDVAADSSPA